MTSISLRINGACARAKVTGPLTSGMVGIPLTIEYDEAWDGLTKNLLCQCRELGSDAGECRTILNVGETAVVAHEVMKAGAHLYLGVEGFSSDGELVIPTTWALCGVIEKGANTAEDLSTDPTLPVWEQLQADMEQLRQDAVTREQMTGVLEDVQSAAQAAAISAGRAEAAAKRAEEAYGAGSQIPAQGLSQAQINALHGMFKVCLFDDSKNVGGAISAFEEAFGITGGESPGEPDEPVVTTYSVEYELVNVSSNNSAAAVAEGAAYSAVLTAAGGYTLDGAAVSVTMGGVDITATAYADGVISIAAVTGDISIFASAVQTGQEVEAVLPDGYTAMFDFRDAKTSVGAGNLYMCNANEGVGHLYSWYNVFGNANSDGIENIGNNTYAKTESTTYQFPDAYTYCGFMRQPAGTKNKVMLPAAYVGTTNSGIVLKSPYIMTDGSAGTAGNADVGYISSDTTYAITVLRANGAKLDIFINGELAASWDGSEIANFAQWSGVVGATTLPYNSGVAIGLTLYERALSDVEVAEVYAYYKTQEVSA